ncbi:MAG: chromosomal replication initiator protein DnaA, partial [Kiritimatiellae bacterium]|nr:chromosomal replication initiator protein DnaA [Kiritimatiellia bacterium]
IQRVVADQFDLRISDMTSRDRSQNVAMPRQIAMFLCRSLTRRSLPEIARAFDKTHATVVHSFKTVRGRMETDPAFRAQVETACAKLGHDPSDLQ